jgi:hypothetical protein
MYEALGGDQPEATPWPALRERDRDGFRDQARAAIKAMRHPTKTMLQAGRETMPVIDHSERTWQAMIDAALPAGQG